MSEDHFQPAKRLRCAGPDYTSAMVVLLVGEKKTAFVVHQDILISNSSFFAAAVKKEWQTEGLKTIDLPDDRSDIVGMYIDWLYAFKKVLQYRIGTKTGKEGSDERLLRAHIFGDKICDLEFANRATDELLINLQSVDAKGVRWFPTKGTVSMVYDKTSKDSPLRKLLVKCHAEHGHAAWFDEDGHRDFLQDLVLELLKQERTIDAASSDKSWKTTPGQYHLKSTAEATTIEDQHTLSGPEDA